MIRNAFFIIVLNLTIGNRCCLGHDIDVPEKVDFGLVNTGISTPAGNVDADYYQSIAVKNIASRSVAFLGISFLYEQDTGPNFFLPSGSQCPNYDPSNYNQPIIIEAGKSFLAVIQHNVRLPGYSSAHARFYWIGVGNEIDSAEVMFESVAVDTQTVFLTGIAGGSKVFCPCNPLQSLNFSPGSMGIFNKTSYPLRIDSISITGDTSDIHDDFSSRGVFYLGGSYRHLPATLDSNSVGGMAIAFEPKSSGSKSISVTLHCTDVENKAIAFSISLTVVGMYTAQPFWTDYPKVVLADVSVGNCITSSNKDLTLFYCGDSLHCLDSGKLSLIVMGTRRQYYTVDSGNTTLVMAPGAQRALIAKYCPLVPGRDTRDTVPPFGVVFDTLMIVLDAPQLDSNRAEVQLDSRTYQYSSAVKQMQANAFSLNAAPNPFQNKVSFQIEGTTQLLRVKVLDCLGRSVYNYFSNSNGENQSLDWIPEPSLPNGVYFANIFRQSSSRDAPDVRALKLVLLR